MTTTTHLRDRFTFLVETLRASGALVVVRLPRGREVMLGRGGLFWRARAVLVAPDDLEAAKADLDRTLDKGETDHARAFFDRYSIDAFTALTTTPATTAADLLEHMQDTTRRAEVTLWLPAADLADELERLAPSLVEAMAADMQEAARHWVHPDSIRDEVLERARDAAEWWPLPDEYGALEHTLEVALARELVERRGHPADGLLPGPFARWLAPALDELVPGERVPSYFPPDFDLGYERAPSPSGPWERIPDDGLPVTPYGPIPVPTDGTGEAVEHEGQWYRWTPLPRMTLADELILAADNGRGLPDLCPPHPSKPGQVWELRGAALSRLFQAELEVRLEVRERITRQVARDNAEGLDEDRAADELAAEVAKRAKEAGEVRRRARTGDAWDHDPTTTLHELRALHIEGEPYPLDVRAAAWLRSIGGAKAREAADRLAGTPPEGGAAAWWHDPHNWPRTLAQVLWFDVVRPKLERERTRGIPAAPLVIVRDLVLPPSHLLSLREDGAILTPEGISYVSVPAVSVSVAKATIERGVFTPAFWRLFGYLLRRQHEQYLATGNAKAAASIDIGTITDLTRDLGFSGGTRDVENVRRALEAGAQLGSARAGEAWRALWAIGGELGQRKRAALRITLGPVLHVDAASYMPKTGKLLAPVLDATRTPKPVGDRRTYERQHAADQALMCLAAERSREGGEWDDGAFVFPFDFDRDRKAIADRTGLYRRSHADLSSRWLDRLLEQGMATELPPPVGRAPFLARADDSHIAITDRGIAAMLASQARRRRARAKGGRARAAKLPK